MGLQEMWIYALKEEKHSLHATVWKGGIAMLEQPQSSKVYYAQSLLALEQDDR